MVSCRVHPGVIIPLGFSASEVPRSRADAACHHKEVICRRERASSPQPRALKAHCSPRCRERSFGSLKTVKLFFGVFEKKETILARRRSAIGLPCFAEGRLSPSLLYACPCPRFARIHPISFSLKRREKKEDPVCVFPLLFPLPLFFPVFPPRASPSPWSSVASASAFTCEIRSMPTRRSSRAPGQLSSRGRGSLPSSLSSLPSPLSSLLSSLPPDPFPVT